MTDSTKILIERLLQDIEETGRLLHDLIAQLNETRVDMVETKIELGTLTNTVEVLADSLEEVKKAIGSADGANKGDIAARIIVTEEAVGALEEELDQLLDQRSQEAIEDRRGHWAIIAAVAGGALGLISAIVTAVATFVG